MRENATRDSAGSGATVIDLAGRRLAGREATRVQSQRERPAHSEQDEDDGWGGADGPDAA